MARIRIKKGPTNSSVPNQMSPAFTGIALQKPSTSTARQLKSVPREDANIEAERGETALVPDKDGLSAHYTIGGNRHTGGGTPLNVPKDTFIFSDTKKMRIKDPEILAEFGKSKGSYTPADLAKKYDINKYRKILADPDSDHLDISTAEKMMGNYNLKLAKLALFQESKKGFPQGIPAVAMPYLSTFNIQPDSILPLKAEEGIAQGQPQQGMPMGKYGGILSKYQGGSQWPNYSDPNYMQPPGQSLGPNYVDLTTQSDWNNMQGPPSPSLDTNVGQGTTTDLQQAGTSIFKGIGQGTNPMMPSVPQIDPHSVITQDPKQLNLPDKPSMYSKGTAKTGIKTSDVDWGIAAAYTGANLANQPHNRRVQEQLDKRMKPEAWMASRDTRDRGDYTRNYGYFRPDQQNVGNMVTGKYGGVLPKAQDGKTQTDLAALRKIYEEGQKKKAHREMRKREQEYIEHLQEENEKKRFAKNAGDSRYTQAKAKQLNDKMAKIYKIMEGKAKSVYDPSMTARSTSYGDLEQQYSDVAGEYAALFPQEPASTFVPGPGSPGMYRNYGLKDPNITPPPTWQETIPVTGIPGFTPIRPIVITKAPATKAVSTTKAAPATADSTSTATKEKHGWYKEGTEYVLYEDPNQKTDPNTIKNY